MHPYMCYQSNNTAANEENTRKASNMQKTVSDFGEIFFEFYFANDKWDDA